MLVAAATCARARERAHPRRARAAVLRARCSFPVACAPRRASRSPGLARTRPPPGKLTNGSDFDSSRTRGKPFQFKIGVGAVIKGWDVGISQMRVGERAVFTISSDYGYGDDGYEPVIPGGATLVFDVELLKFGK